jgi:hypothetical protein
MRTLIASALLFLSGTASAWELETHVGLTHQAALHSRLDAWLRERGLSSGLYETLALAPQTQRRVNRESDRYTLDDRGVLDELSRLDAALGVSPDGARQPAVGWLLAGAALEGSRMDRVRNHFVDPRHGSGLAEQGPTGSQRLRVESARDGSGTIRGIFTGANFDGTGERADRWLDSPENALSRTRLLDELERASIAPTIAERQTALARALLCIGALENVLQSVGDPAHARGDFTANYTQAGAPLERWAAMRYGRSVPAQGPDSPAPVLLAHFIVAPDGSGLADEVARGFVPPGSRAPGQGPGKVSPGAVAMAADSLLPRIGRRSSQLLDFLLRGAIVADEDGGFHVGPLGLGKGHITYVEENIDGTRRVVLQRDTQGGAPGATLLAGIGRGKGVLVYRGTDANGEPIVLSAISATR